MPYLGPNLSFTDLASAIRFSILWLEESEDEDDIFMPSEESKKAAAAASSKGKGAASSKKRVLRRRRARVLRRRKAGVMREAASMVDEFSFSNLQSTMYLQFMLCCRYYRYFVLCVICRVPCIFNFLICIVCLISM